MKESCRRRRERSPILRRHIRRVKGHSSHPRDHEGGGGGVGRAHRPATCHSPPCPPPASPAGTIIRE
jgi:hypothetical protein